MAEERFPYELTTVWLVPGRIEDVFEVLTDGPNMVRWWPEAYHRVLELEPGDERGIGRKIEIVTRGRLPYELTWQMVITEIDPPTRIKLRASGELAGIGEWTLRQLGGNVELTYVWRVGAEKRWMQALEGLLKPVFAWNHQWVMKRGEEGLRQELARRVAK